MRGSGEAPCRARLDQATWMREAAEAAKTLFLAACAAAYETMEYDKTAALHLAELERLAFRASQQMGLALLESRLATDPHSDPDGDYRCRRCQGKLRIQQRLQERTLNTVLGELSYRRPYGVCDRCQLSSVPLDEALGIPARGSSISHRQKVCHAAVVGRSFEDAHELLSVQAGVSVSPKHARTIAEQEGRRLVDQRAQTVKALEEQRWTPSPAERPALLVVTCDGGKVQTRAASHEGRWKEDKIGAVYDATPTPQLQPPLGEYEGAQAQTKTYVATMENWEAMGWMMRLEAEQRGYAKAQHKLFIADGAVVLRELKNLHFPDATFILDWPHAVGHLSDCAKAAFGEGSRAARKWFDHHRQMLWEGKVEALIGRLRRLSGRVGPPRPADTETSPRVVLHRNATSYFPNNQEAMDYPSFCAKGWPIGSGVAEGAVKQFALRIKGSEKFWNISGAEEMLALCALYHSEDGRWQRYWRDRAQPKQ